MQLRNKYLANTMKVRVEFDSNSIKSNLSKIVCIHAEMPGVPVPTVTKRDPAHKGSRARSATKVVELQGAEPERIETAAGTRRRVYGPVTFSSRKSGCCMRGN